MSDKEIEVKLIVKIDKNGELRAGIKVDFEHKEFTTIREICFLKYLKDMMEQHAQPIIYAASTLAELNEITAQHDIDCDED